MYELLPSEKIEFTYLHEPDTRRWCVTSWFKCSRNDLKVEYVDYLTVQFVPTPPCSCQAETADLCDCVVILQSLVCASGLTEESRIIHYGPLSSIETILKIDSIVLNIIQSQLNSTFEEIITRSASPLLFSPSKEKCTGSSFHRANGNVYLALPFEPKFSCLYDGSPAVLKHTWVERRKFVSYDGTLSTSCTPCEPPE